MEIETTSWDWVTNLIIVLVLIGLVAGISVMFGQPWWIAPLFVLICLGVVGLMDLFFNKLGG